jgi:AhpD family alkylhydroperoxidase
MTGLAEISADSGGAGRAERELDDALYYLRRGCGPCAQRHFDRALRHGATAEQIDAVRAAVAATAAGSAHGR